MHRPAVRELTILREHIESTDVTSVIGSGLHEYLDDVQNRVAIVHAATQDAFVNYDPAQAKIA